MPQDKMLNRMEAKLDALLDKAGLDPDDYQTQSPHGYGGRVARELTPQEQEAIDNAPKTPVGAVGPMAPAATATVPPAALPWPDYDDMSVGDIVARARTQGADAATRARILAYERANKNRTGVITPMVNWNS